MKLFLKILFALLLTLSVATTSAYYFWYKPKFNHKRENISATLETTITEKNAAKLTTKSLSLKAYAKKHNYNTEVGFLIDLTLNSGSNRFFIMDLKNNTVLNQGLVTHGRCNQRWLEGRKYGNEPGCGCSSLGKYRIGKSYNGRFGLAYKLHGLDSSNSNAFKRYVVLHAHECVPESEVNPLPICQSDGCPTVSPLFLQQLKTILNNSKKPVLLWIYE